MGRSGSYSIIKRGETFIHETIVSCKFSRSVSKEKGHGKRMIVIGCEGRVNKRTYLKYIGSSDSGIHDEFWKRSDDPTGQSENVLSVYNKFII